MIPVPLLNPKLANVLSREIRANFVLAALERNVAKR
jgi:hypothetical protein